MDISHVDPQSPVDPPGFDGGSLVDWFASHGIAAPVRATMIEGGHSNLTYLLVDGAGKRAVLRRPPLSSALASAHDVVRERRIIEALKLSSVPVPRVIGSSPGPSPLGAPFYVMSFVDGVVARTPADAEPLSGVARASASRHLAHALADLHAIEPAEVGLERLGRATGYMARQLKRWHAQYEAQHSTAIPEISAVHARLVSAVREHDTTSIVHGDFRLDNCIVSTTGELRAVLDWELCTLGDPLADLATFLVYWTGPADEPSAWKDTATTVAGFWNRDELLAAYVERRSIPAPELAVHLAFASWRLACILAGVHARRLAGALGADGAAGAEHLGDQAVAAARQAQRILDGDSSLLGGAFR